MMLVYLVRVYLIVTTFRVLQFQNLDCPNGWFGAECKLKCHCAISVSCGTNGECLNKETCAIGFFGPGCQYMDLVKMYATNKTETYLTDNNDTSCNPNGTSTSVVVELSTSLWFSWYRIIVSNNSNVLKFVTQVNNGKLCINETKFIVSEAMLDVQCNNDVPAKNLRILGEIAKSVCSIYISGGRNVAIKQATHQTSNTGETDTSGRAVDGEKNAKLQNGHCSHSKNEHEAVWTLTYSQPQLIHTLVIYNRNEYTFRQNGLVVTMVGSNFKVTYEFKGIAPLVYTYVIPKPVPLIKLQLKQKGNIQKKNQYLTLCEVETYIDTMCPEFKYGIQCENCSCKEGHTCNVVTGTCTSECPIGYYSNNCSLKCSENCLYDICNHGNGNCFDCIPGYVGSTCYKVCDNGTFGTHCALKCSKQCSEPCHHITGLCTCKLKNKKGTNCAECVPGQYGKDCNTTCSRLCKDRECDARTGECSACVGNRVGPMCAGCNDAFFGPLCLSNCSENCVNRTCHILSGKCKKCRNHFKGEWCTAVENDSIWQYIIPAVLLLPMLCMCVVCWRMGVEIEPEAATLS